MIAKLKIDIYNRLNWFDSNLMVANPSKCIVLQVMFLGLKKSQNLGLEVNGDAITNSCKTTWCHN